MGLVAVVTLGVKAWPGTRTPISTPRHQEQQEAETEGPAGLRDPHPQPGIPSDFPHWPPLGFLGPGSAVSGLFLHFEGPLSWKLKPHELFPSHPTSSVCLQRAKPTPCGLGSDLEGLSEFKLQP